MSDAVANREAVPAVRIAPDSLIDDRWRPDAECRSVGPDLFFPLGSTGPAIDHIAAAKAVCAQCGVRQPCLDYALDTRQDAGVWGGLSDEERRVVRRQRRRAQLTDEALTA